MNHSVNPINQSKGPQLHWGWKPCLYKAQHLGTRTLTLPEQDFREIWAVSTPHNCPLHGRTGSIVPDSIVSRGQPPRTRLQGNQIYFRLVLLIVHFLSSEDKHGIEEFCTVSSLGLIPTPRYLIFQNKTSLFSVPSHTARAVPGPGSTTWAQLPLLLICCSPAQLSGAALYCNKSRRSPWERRKRLCLSSSTQK